MRDRLLRVVGNYETTLRLSAAGRIPESEIQERVAHYSVAAVSADIVLDQVRQVLCSHGIVPMMFPAYHAYSRELGKLTRQELSEESLRFEYAITMSKWVARGLVQSVLKDIGCSVFNLVMPEPPSESQREEGLPKSA
jgi:hypothetical protein